MAVLPGLPAAREAVTHYRVMERFEGFTHIECRLETGRTHQIRVHLASLGHPLLGDPVYGGDRTRFERLHPNLICGQCLHARELRFNHPRPACRCASPLRCPTIFRRCLSYCGGGDEHGGFLTQKIWIKG